MRTHRGARRAVVGPPRRADLGRPQRLRPHARLRPRVRLELLRPAPRARRQSLRSRARLARYRKHGEVPRADAPPPE